MRYLLLILSLNLVMMHPLKAQGSPVIDTGMTLENTVVIVLKDIANFIYLHGAEILTWTQRALNVVNAIVRNYKMVESTYEIITDIGSIYGELIQQIQTSELEDKVRYTAVLTALITRTFDLITQMTTTSELTEFQGGLVMDDADRITIIKAIHKKAFRLRRLIKYLRSKINRDVMRLKLRRQNQEVIHQLFKYN